MRPRRRPTLLARSRALIPGRDLAFAREHATKGQIPSLSDLESRAADRNLKMLRQKAHAALRQSHHECQDCLRVSGIQDSGEDSRQTRDVTYKSDVLISRAVVYAHPHIWLVRVSVDVQWMQCSRQFSFLLTATKGRTQPMQSHSRI